LFKNYSFIICTFHAQILWIENSFENLQEDEKFVWHSFIHTFVLHSLTHLSMCQMCFQCMIFKCKIYEPMTQRRNFAQCLSLICCILHLWWLNLFPPFSKKHFKLQKCMWVVIDHYLCCNINFTQLEYPNKICW
jgi:hypothetical protein